MPHDARGREIRPGDTVMVPFRVKVVHQTEQYCNVDIETIADMPPAGGKTSLAAINTQQMLRANPGDDVTLDITIRDGMTRIGMPDFAHTADAS